MKEFPTMMDVKKGEISQVTEDLKKLQKEAKEIELPKGWYWYKESMKILIHIQDGLETDLHKLDNSRFYFDDYIIKLKSYVNNLRTAIERIKKKDISAEELESLTKTIKSDINSIGYYLGHIIPELETLEKHYSNDSDLKKKKILIEMDINFAINPLLAEMLINNWDLVEKIIEIYKDHSRQEGYYHYIWDTTVHFDQFIYPSLSEKEIAALRKKAVGNKTAEQIYRDPEFMGELKDFLHQLYVKKQSLKLQGEKNFRNIIMSLAYIVKGGTMGEHLGKNICQIAIPNLSQVIKTKEDLEFLYNTCLKTSKIDYLVPMRVTEVISGYKEFIDKGLIDWKELSSRVIKDMVKHPEIYEIGQAYLNFSRILKDHSISPEELFNIIDLSIDIAVKKLGKKYVDSNYYSFSRIIYENFEEIMILSKEFPLKKLFELFCDLIFLSIKSKIANIREPKYISAGLNCVIKKLLSLEQFYEETKKATKENKKLQDDIFTRFMPEFSDSLLIKGISWHEIILGSSEFLSSGSDSRLIKNFLDDITPIFWNKLADFSLIVSLSKHDMRRLYHILGYLNKDSKVFLQYLIMFRPNQALDIFETYVFINDLGVDYNKEMKLFLKIATPITLKINNFSQLIDILIPIKDLSGQKRNKFTSFLDSSLLIFQGMKYKFTDALSQTPGFENITDFSFVELVYIYLKHSENPDIKVKKINKKLAKIKKNISKIIRIINNKNNIKDINENDYNILNASLEEIAKIFFEPLLLLHKESSRERTIDTIKKIFNINKSISIEEKIWSANFRNAIILNRKIQNIGKENCKQLCFKLIREHLLSNTYPFKRIPKAYPWNDENNQAWLKRIPNSFWLKEFEKKYSLTIEDFKEDNVEQRIEHHLKQSQDILNKLGIKLIKITLDEIEKQFKIIKEEQKNENLLQDLKTQINAIKSLTGQVESKKDLLGEKIIITSEFDPLEILQMGNYVTGSCLNSYGSNYWSTIVNACEVNKKVLWAKNHKGEVLARLLIAVDEDKRIVRFPIYYTTNIKMDRFFNNYIIELAKKCKFGINGDSNKVLRIFDAGWYTDGTVKIGEELQQPKRYRMTG